MVAEIEGVVYLAGTRVSTIFLREDGIFQLLLKEASHIELEDSLEIFSALKTYSNPANSICLLTIVGEDCTWDKDAREFTATPEYAQLIRGEAIIVKSLAHKLVFNFTLKTFKPKMHMSLFDDEDKGIEWLESLKNDRSYHTNEEFLNLIEFEKINVSGDCIACNN